MAEVGNRRVAKKILVPFEKEKVHPHKLQNRAYMAKMIRPSWTVNQNIVKKDEDKVTKKGSENLVHERLEGRRSISQAKGHG